MGKSFTEEMGSAVLPSNVGLPRDRYATRVKDIEFKLSSKQNPMLVVTVELYAPDKVLISGQSYAIAGVEDTMYLTLTEAAWPRCKDFMQKLGLKAQIDDIDNPNVEQFKNKTFDAIWGSEQYQYRKDLTPEQIAAGMKPEQAEIIKDKDGNPVIGYRSKCQKVLGAAHVQPSVAA